MLHFIEKKDFAGMFRDPRDEEMTLDYLGEL